MSKGHKRGCLILVLSVSVVLALISYVYRRDASCCCSSWIAWLLAGIRERGAVCVLMTILMCSFLFLPFSFHFCTPTLRLDTVFCIVADVVHDLGRGGRGPKLSDRCFVRSSLQVFDVV